VWQSPHSWPKLATCEDRVSDTFLTTPCAPLTKTTGSRSPQGLWKKPRTARSLFSRTTSSSSRCSSTTPTASHCPPVVYQNVTRANERPGVCTDDPPLSVMASLPMRLAVSVDTSSKCRDWQTPGTRTSGAGGGFDSGTACANSGRGPWRKFCRRLSPLRYRRSRPWAHQNDRHH